MDLGKVGASFLGSLILGLLSHVMSRRYKRPVIIFIVPELFHLFQVELHRSNTLSSLK